MSINALRPLGPTAGNEERRQVATAAREFEAMFLLQMLKQMRQSMLAEETEEPGLGAATMTETFDVELSRHLAGQRGGLSTMLEEALGRDAGVSIDSTAKTGVLEGIGLPLEGGSHASKAIVVPGFSRTNSGPSEGAHHDDKTESNEPTLTRLPGRISSDFGWRGDPITGATRFHRGMDIAAAYGEEVPAAAEGTVVFSGTRGGYGKLVVVQHAGGAETRYAHLSQLDVGEGDMVRAGDIVGRVGQSGRATGPHLHFEVRDEGNPVDPSRGVRLASVQGND